MHFDAFIKYLALCLQPVAKMLFVQQSLMLNLKCLDKKTRWDKRMEQRLGLVCNCDVFGPFVMSRQAISTFSTHFLKSGCREVHLQDTLLVKKKTKKQHYSQKSI